MSTCNICNKSKSRFVMNNKSVCLRCDDLLFDIEIECDDEVQAKALPTQTVTETKKPILNTVKK